MSTLTREEQIEHILKKLNEIIEYCKGWKNCQDGSYEMALANSGYFKLLEELDKLRKKET